MGENLANPEFRPVLPTLKSMRADAHRALAGHWTNAVLCTLLFSVVASVVLYILLIPIGLSISKEDLSDVFFDPGLELVGVLLVVLPLSFGYSVAFLRHMRGEADDELITRPFQAFKHYSRYLATSFLMFIFLFLWTLLFVVPGIVKSYAYAMTPYIMHDHPELSADDCINRSKEMMRGYKWKLFCLDLSFIGWMFLCIFTLGILTFWVQPYMQCSRIRFYEVLKAMPSTPTV